MKNLFVSILFVFVSFVSFSQKISVHVTEVKDFIHSDSVNYTVAMSESRSDNEKRAVDGTYNIDLDEKTLSFKTLKNSGNRTINSFTKDGETISVNFTDDYLLDENGNKLEVTLVIDQKTGKVVFTYFDPIYKYTFAQDFTKNEIATIK